MGEAHITETSRLDGNAAAGLLSEVFTRDATSARSTCMACGAIGSIGALHMYAHEMGAVLRCPQCEWVVLRVVRTKTHVWLDATGSRSIAIQIRSDGRPPSVTGSPATDRGTA